jgi:hypothetical protein
VEGTWASQPDGVRLATTSADGQPTGPGEACVLAVEGDALVWDDGTGRVFLVRP